MKMKKWKWLRKKIKITSDNFPCRIFITQWALAWSWIADPCPSPQQITMRLNLPFPSSTKFLVYLFFLERKFIVTFQIVLFLLLFFLLLLLFRYFVLFLILLFWFFNYLFIVFRSYYTFFELLTHFYQSRHCIEYILRKMHFHFD